MCSVTTLLLMNVDVCPLQARKSSVKRGSPTHFHYWAKRSPFPPPGIISSLMTLPTNPALYSHQQTFFHRPKKFVQAFTSSSFLFLRFPQNSCQAWTTSLPCMIYPVMCLSILHKETCPNNVLLQQLICRDVWDRKIITSQILTTA